MPATYFPKYAKKQHIRNKSCWLFWKQWKYFFVKGLWLRRPLHQARYENWPIWNWKKSYRLLVNFIYMFKCSEVMNDMIWSSFWGTFHIGYFDWFEIQNPIWVALCMSVGQVCAWKHENSWKHGTLNRDSSTVVFLLILRKF